MSFAATLHRVMALPLRWAARQRRARGRYDRQTLRLFQRAQRTGDVCALLDYLSFRRDLGHALHPRHVAPLLAQLAALPDRERWRAAALLSEVDAAPPQVWEALPAGAGLTTAAPHQECWRRSFGALVDESRSRGICVVGNAGALAGQGLGARIDAAGTVIRFNRFQSNVDQATDIGSRTSVWVTSPSYQGPRPDVDWVVVSGPDMCFQLRNWALLTPRLLAARPVLSVPLSVWRDLVKVLNAPPSAGVLMLAWLCRLGGGWAGITAAGIGVGTQGRYHLADLRKRAGTRHAWAAEASLIEVWAAQGLELLPHASARPSP
jgi:hypothetical protein